MSYRTSAPRLYKSTPYSGPKARYAKATQQRRQFAARPPVMYLKADEKQTFDSSRSATAIVSSASWTGCEMDPDDSVIVGALSELFHPPTGITQGSRQGRRILVHKIKIRGFINIPAKSAQSTADEGTYIRLAVVQDKQTNGAQLNSEDVFKQMANDTTTITAFQNPEKMGRFRVWKDKVIIINPPDLSNDTGATGGLVQAGHVRPFKFFLTFKNPIVVNYEADQAGGGSIADTIDNSFHLLANCSNTSLAPTIQYSCRTVFSP